MNIHNTLYCRMKKPFVFIVLLLSLCTLSAAWQWIPLKSWTAVGKLLPAMAVLGRSPMGPFLVIGTYVLGGLIMFPIFILIPVTVLIFGPLIGPLYALLGCLVSAVVCYAAGHAMGYETVSQIAGKRTRQISKQLDRHGFLTIAAFRFFPIAPYTIINLIAGAFRVRFRDYTCGTAVGLAPGIAIIAVFEHQVENVLRNPGPNSIAALGGFCLLALLVFFWLKRKLDRAAERI